TGRDSICSTWSKSASTTSWASARVSGPNFIGRALYSSRMITTALLATVVAIKAGTLIDGRADAPRHNQTILIRDNRIEAVGDNVAVPAGAQVIDLSKSTVLPGLIDTHTHLFLQGEDPAAGGYD